MEASPTGRAGEPGFRDLADHAPVMLWLARADGDATWANRTLLDFLGRPLEACLRFGWLDSVHPDDRPTAAEAFARAREERRGLQMELRVRRHDGAERWMLVTASPQRNGTGATTGFIGSNVDVTERRLADEAAARTTELLQALLRSVPDLVWVKDTEGRITLANQPVYDILGGGDPAAVLGRSVDDLTPDPARRERIKAGDARVMRTGEPAIVEESVGDGAASRVFETSKAPLRDAEGRVIGVVGVARDVTGIRSAERAVARSEAEYRALFDAAGIGHAEIDLASGRFLRVNRRYCEIVGYGPDELRHLTFLEITHPDDRARNHAAISPFMDDRHDRFEIEKRYVRKDGGVVWVHLTATLIRDEQGRPVRLLGSALDITERRLAEDAARAAEERLRFALDAAYMIAFEWDIARDEVRRAFSNDAVLPATAETAPDRLEDIERVVHPEDRGLFRANIRAALETGEYRSEFRIVAPDGAIRWLLERGRVEFSPGGRPARLTGLSQDVTDRLDAIARLRETESTLRSFYESSTLMMGVVELTPDDRIVHLYDNPATARFFGRHPGGTRGRSSESLGAEEAVRRQWADAYRESERTGDPVTFEYRHPSEHGELWLSVVASFIGPAADGRSRFSYVAEDVTERKLAEQGLREEARRKDEFLATLAHELRNPLAPIRNAVQLLEMQGDASPGARLAREIIERQLRQMVRLIDDLLDVSRITRGRLELRREPVALRTVLEAAVETSQPHLEQGRHELQVDFVDAPLPLDADPVRLAQVFANLLNNACKFTEPGGTIRLATRRDGDEAVVTVADTGIGFLPGDAERLFEMFMQVERPLDRAHGGLGIGLMLVKRLVELHGGRVRARSAGPGRGSEFEVRLPILMAPVPAVAEASPAPGRPAPHRCRVLVVDDNEDAALTLELLLRHGGCATEVAHDGVEAVALAERARPDVVLLDLGMPRMNGYEACRAIREQPWGRRMMLVALTGWGQEDDRRRSSDAGFDAHLVKPVDLAAVASLLEQAAARAVDLD